MESSQSFVLIKPDGIKAGLQPSVEARLVGAGLAIVDRRTLRLTGDQIFRLYLRDGIGQPIGAAFLQHYLHDQEVAVIAVEGAEALRATNTIKFSFRRSYARHAFANVIHAPENSREFVQQSRALALNHRETPGLDGHDEQLHRQRRVHIDTRAILKVSDQDLDALVQEIVQGYESIFRDHPITIEFSRKLIAQGYYSVVLRTGVYTRIDEVVVALLQTNSCSSLKAAIACALEVESGHQPVQIVVKD